MSIIMTHTKIIGCLNILVWFLADICAESSWDNDNFFHRILYMLCFRLVARTVLVTCWYFDCCWASLAQASGTPETGVVQVFSCCSRSAQKFVFVNKQPLNSSWKESQEATLPSLCTKQSWVRDQTKSFRALSTWFLKLPRMERLHNLSGNLLLWLTIFKRKRGFFCVQMEYFFFTSCQLSQVSMTHYSWRFWLCLLNANPTGSF